MSTDRLKCNHRYRPCPHCLFYSASIREYQRDQYTPKTSANPLSLPGIDLDAALEAEAEDEEPLGLLEVGFATGSEVAVPKTPCRVAFLSAAASVADE